jgi:hypothetical protein
VLCYDTPDLVAVLGSSVVCVDTNSYSLVLIAMEQFRCKTFIQLIAECGNGNRECFAMLFNLRLTFIIVILHRTCFF